MLIKRDKLNDQIKGSIIVLPSSSAFDFDLSILQFESKNFVFWPPLGSASGGLSVLPLLRGW